MLTPECFKWLGIASFLKVQHRTFWVVTELELDYFWGIFAITGQMVRLTVNKQKVTSKPLQMNEEICKLDAWKNDYKLDLSDFKILGFLTVISLDSWNMWTLSLNS